MLEQTIKRLRQRRKQITSQIAALESEAKRFDEAIRVLAKLTGKGGAVKVRTMSAAGRKAVAAAQRARWAKIKAQKK
jgi:hypothetical protein